jgi:HSP20 family protein
LTTWAEQAWPPRFGTAIAEGGNADGGFQQPSATTTTVWQPIHVFEQEEGEEMLNLRWPIQRDLWAEMNRLQRDINRAFGRFGPSGELPRTTPAYPALNLWQDEESFYVEAELPGMKLDDLEILATGSDQLTIKGKREAPPVEQGVWHRRERGYGGFARVLNLPHEVDTDHVEAEFKQGVLCVKLPKREEVKPRRITVKSN